MSRITILLSGEPGKPKPERFCVEGGDIHPNDLSYILEDCRRRWWTDVPRETRGPRPDDDRPPTTTRLFLLEVALARGVLAETLGRDPTAPELGLLDLARLVAGRLSPTPGPGPTPHVPRGTLYPRADGFQHDAEFHWARVALGKALGVEDEELPIWNLIQLALPYIAAGMHDGAKGVGAVPCVDIPPATHAGVERKDTPGDFNPFQRGHGPDGLPAEVPTDDRGQWDGPKRLMRVALWRWARGGDDIVPFVLGVGPEEHATAMQPLLPFGMALAEPCRRLGFLRLGMAAAGFAFTGDGWVAAPLARDCPAALTGADPDHTRDTLLSLHTNALASIGPAHEAYLVRIENTRAQWNQGAGPAPEPMDRAAFDRLCHPGDFDRPDLDAALPLSPLTDR
jgi:hypothetical protein